MSKVSILIPCYNSAQYIAETLECCLNQTYHDMEVIVVDDGSTDESVAIAKQYESSQVKIYEQLNAGACRARNIAFERSTGDYIVYLDADDLINETFVESHLKTLANKSKISISFGIWDRFYKSIEEAKFPDQLIYQDYTCAFDLLLEMWRTGSMLGVTCYMTPRTLIQAAGRWNENLLKNQDGEYFSRVLMLADAAYHVPEAKLYYRTGAYNSVSKGNSEKKISSLLDTLLLYKANALSHEDSERVRIALSSNLTSFIYIYGNQYQTLCKKAEAEISELGVGYRTYHLPPRVQKVCKCIGFPHFMKLRKILLNR